MDGKTSMTTAFKGILRQCDGGEKPMHEWNEKDIVITTKTFQFVEEPLELPEHDDEEYSLDKMDLYGDTLVSMGEIIKENV